MSPWECILKCNGGAPPPAPLPFEPNARRERWRMRDFRVTPGERDKAETRETLQHLLFPLSISSSSVATSRIK